MKRYFYNHGLPFSKTLDDNLQSLADRVYRDNKAGMIVLDGGVGEGKTTLAVHLADFLQGAYEKDGEGYRKVPERFIDFEKQLAMGGMMFTKALKSCFNEGLKVCIYDEAGDFNRRGSLTRFNALLNRVFETYRAFKIVVILSLPSFHVLDSDLLDKKIPRLLIHCYDRNAEYGEYKGYSLYRMYYLQERMKKLVVKPHGYDIVDANFHGHFLDLEKERSRALDRFSTTGKMDILEMADIKFEGLLSYDEVGKQVQRSVVWVREKCKKLKLKPKKIYKKRMFFEPYVIDVLMHELDREAEVRQNDEEKKKSGKGREGGEGGEGAGQRGK